MANKAISISKKLDLFGLKNLHPDDKKVVQFAYYGFTYGIIKGFMTSDFNSKADRNEYKNCIKENKAYYPTFYSFPNTVMRSSIYGAFYGFASVSLHIFPLVVYPLCVLETIYYLSKIRKHDKKLKYNKKNIKRSN